VILTSDIFMHKTPATEWISGECRLLSHSHTGYGHPDQRWRNWDAGKKDLLHSNYQATNTLAIFFILTVTVFVDYNLYKLRNVLTTDL